ncbi:MAG: putative toxin-antitoxin system toxin component, PIN family [Nanoarchaeota archaeon]
MSALGWNGKPKQIFQKCVHTELELITSSKQIDELQRVLNYPKFDFTEQEKETFIEIVLEIAILVEITGKLNVISEDPDDNVILDTAIIGNADYLITGDPHLLKLKQFLGVKIITANDFLDVL